MAEVAGLVLGAIPLAIWALEKYAEPFEEYRHYRESILTFRSKLNIQYYLLQITLENAGLDITSSDSEMRICFQNKVPDIVDELMFTVRNMNDIILKLLKNLGIDSHIKPEAVPEHIQWEWRRVKHSFSARKRKDVIDGLQRLNNALKDCLERTEMPAEDESCRVNTLRRRFNTHRCDSLRKCFGSLHRALQSGIHCECSSPHQVAIDLDWRAYESRTARFKVAVSYDTSSHQAPQKATDAWRKLDIMPEPTKTDSATMSVPISTPTASLRSPSPSSLQVTMSNFRFWRPRTPPTPSPNSVKAIVPQASFSAPPSPPKEPEITRLCEAICSTAIPWSMTGLLKDPEAELESQNFLLKHNTNAARIIQRVPLKTLLFLQSQPFNERNPHLYLTTKQRYGIAAEAAWSVLYLSGSPWLRGQWDEDRACIFLEERNKVREIPSENTCLSCPLDGPESTEQNQQDQHGNPQPAIDPLITRKYVFALGILLIELCLKKSITNTREAIGRADTTAFTPSMLEDYYAAEENLDMVRSEAGDSYGNAVERCIKFVFSGRSFTKHFNFPSFQQTFYNTVVAPVQATYLQFPDTLA